MKGTGQVSAHNERNLVSILLKMMKETGQVSAHDERNRDKSSNHFKRN